MNLPKSFPIPELYFARKIPIFADGRWGRFSISFFIKRIPIGILFYLIINNLPFFEENSRNDGSIIFICQHLDLKS